MHTYLGLQVTGLDVNTTYDIGDEISLTCCTDLNFTSISWMANDTGETLLSMLATENGDDNDKGSSCDLVLRVEASEDLYLTCRIDSIFGVQLQTVQIRVESGVKTGDIVAGVIGSVIVVVAAIALAAVLIYFYVRHNRKK